MRARYGSCSRRGSSTTWKARRSSAKTLRISSSVRALPASATSSRWKWMLAVPSPFQSPSRAARCPSATASARPVQGVRRLTEPAYDGAFDEGAGAVDVLDVLDGQHPYEDPAVELVDEQPLVGEQPERLAQRVAGDAERAADAVLRQPCPGREVALGDAAPEDVRDPLGGAGAAQQGAVVGQSASAALPCPEFNRRYKNETTWVLKDRSTILYLAVDRRRPHRRSHGTSSALRTHGTAQSSSTLRPSSARCP